MYTVAYHRGKHNLIGNLKIAGLTKAVPFTMGLLSSNNYQSKQERTKTYPAV